MGTEQTGEFTTEESQKRQNIFKDLLSILCHETKINLRCHLTPVRMVKVKTMDDSLCWRWCGVIEIHFHCSWEYKPEKSLLKSVWQFLRKLGINITNNPAITFLGIFPKDSHSYLKDIYSTKFLLALFVRVKIWNNLNYPQLKNGFNNNGTFTQWSITHQKKLYLEISMQMDGTRKNNRPKNQTWYVLIHKLFLHGMQRIKVYSPQHMRN